MFGFLENILSATVKVAITPIAIVKDVIEGEPFESTGDLLSSAGDDIGDAIDDLVD